MTRWRGRAGQPGPARLAGNHGLTATLTTAGGTGAEPDGSVERNVDPVGLGNSASAVRCGFVRVAGRGGGDDPRHERLAGVSPAAPDPADVDPARPRRRRQGR